MSTVSSLSSASISSALQADQTRLDKPITALQTEATADQAEISAWAAIQGNVSSLNSALSGIAKIASINTLKATSSDTNVAIATAAASATAGTYNLTNISLARTQELYSAVKSSAAANIGAGSAGSLTFTLQGGATETVQIAASAQTPAGIAAAINAKAGGVQASVIGTSSGARLVLQSSAAGSANAFSFTGTGGLAGLHYSASATGGSFHAAQTARNAALDINGVPVTSETNTITSAVTGLTVTLAASGAASLTIASSAGAISGALSTVATSLNTAIASINKQIAYTPASSATASASATAAKSGPLLGNFTATDLSDQLVGAISGAAASGYSAAAIGFSVSAKGAITFSSASFNAAYAKDPAAVTTLVNKIYSSLTTLTTAALGDSSAASGGTKNQGEIAAQTASLKSAITSLNAQATQITKDNDAALKILVQEYTAAESAATNAQISQSYLSIFTSTGSGSG